MFVLWKAKLKNKYTGSKGAIYMNPRKTLILVFLSMFILSSFGVGCGAINKLLGKDKQQSKQGDQKKDKQKIGVVLSGSQEDTAQIRKGLQDAARKEDAQLVFLESKDQGKDSEQDSEQKGSKKESNQDGKDSKSGLKDKNLKALIVLGEGSEQSSEILKSAAKQKIPIVGIGQVSDTKVDGIVTPDYFRIGEMQAEFVKSKLPQGNIVLLQSAAPGAEEVVAGNKSALAQSSGLKVVQTFASPTKNSSPAAAFDDYLKKNPGGVQAVIASDSKLALEAIEMLKKSNLNKKVIVVGAGAHKAALDQIASGDLHADIDKAPYLQGLYAYKMASQLGKKQTTDADRTVATEAGETPAKLVPLQLAKPENLAQFQKIYAQPQVSSDQEDKKGDKSSSSGDKGSKDKEQSQQGDSQKKSGESGQSGEQPQSKGTYSSSGATQVREKIRTETTREMLGPDGKVMGTETEVKEEVRTLPAALVDAQKSQQAEQSKAAGQDKQADKQQKKDTQGGESQDSSGK